jgi:cell wall-associated NlpC family hydrolase
MRCLKLMLCVGALLFCLSGFAQASEAYRQGDKAPEIAAVQSKLRGMGYIVGTADGFFSWKFTQAVKAYQRSQGLKPDGVIDPLTYYRIMGKPFPKLSVKPPDKQAAAIIATAKRYIGVPYRFGGVTPKGFDCSGYVQFVFNQHDKTLPRAADVQYKTGKFVLRSQLQPGDLVFFTTYEAGPSHNGIYVGNGQFIHASSSRGVMISKLDDSYWKPRYHGSRRVL